MTSASVRRASRPSSLTASTRRLASLIVTSAWLLLALVIAAVIAVLTILHRGDAEGSARLANAEITALLERDEVVEHRVAVMQRNWWDYFRVTHGVVAATDRRLLFVGIPPETLVRRGFEPPEYVVASFRYDQGASYDLSRQFLGTMPGVQLAAQRVTGAFAFSSDDRARADSVLAVLVGRRETLRLASDAGRRATDATVAASRRAIYHLVQRGEALDVIARRYGVSSDSIVAWNSLPTTRITAGSRLLVRPERQ